MPNYVDGDERCAYVEYSGEYVNRKCNIKGGYICEKLAYGFTGKSSYSRISMACTSLGPRKCVLDMDSPSH